MIAGEAGAASRDVIQHSRKERQAWLISTSNPSLNAPKMSLGRLTVIAF